MTNKTRDLLYLEVKAPEFEAEWVYDLEANRGR